MSTTKKATKRARKGQLPPEFSGPAGDAAGEEIVEHLGMRFPRNLRVDEAMQTGNMSLVVAVRAYRAEFAIR
jgi:hypothetical protein